jgi:hypothetical protein
MLLGGCVVTQEITDSTTDDYIYFATGPPAAMTSAGGDRRGELISAVISDFLRPMSGTPL